MAGMLAGTATGNIDAMAAEKIGEAEAKEIAAEDAGHSVSDVRFDRIEIGTEQGASVYEIEFRTADVEYDYDIAIADGEIVNESRELRRPTARGSQVSRARAKEIALQDAGVDEKDATFTKFENGDEDGIAVYEIEFEDAKVPACVAAEEKANAETGTGKTGREAAIAAALSHAGFNADEVSGLRCEKDYDDGREIYDVEFRHGGYEYNYDIDAHSYRIVEWDKDYDD